MEFPRNTFFHGFELKLESNGEYEKEPTHADIDLGRMHKLKTDSDLKKNIFLTYFEPRKKALEAGTRTN